MKLTYDELLSIFASNFNLRCYTKGLAYVTYALPANAITAMDEMDGTIFQGRLIHLMPAKVGRCRLTPG